MNPELYERYLAKKAKKLGITVGGLKALGTSSPVSEWSVGSSDAGQAISLGRRRPRRRTLQSGFDRCDKADQRACGGAGDYPLQSGGLL